MQRHFKSLALLSCLALCLSAPAVSQEQYPDSAFYDDIDTVANAELQEKSEPERAIIYNNAAPGATTWEQATRSNAYDYRDKKEHLEEREPKTQPPGCYRLLVGIVHFLTSAAGKTILWTALILILGYVAFRIIAGQASRLFGRRDRMPADTETGAVTEQGLLDSNWEGHLKKALEAGDTRLAIRYSYMHILQALQARGLIIYRPDKTNAGYYQELSETLRQPFRRISRQYEYTWYGEFLPEQDAMNQHMHTYESLKKTIASA